MQDFATTSTVRRLYLGHHQSGGLILSFKGLALSVRGEGLTYYLTYASTLHLSSRKGPYNNLVSQDRSKRATAEDAREQHTMKILFKS